MPLQSWRRSLPSLTGPWSWGHAWTAGCTHFGTARPGTACWTPCSRPPGASTTRTPCCARLCTTVYTTAPTGESGQLLPPAGAAKPHSHPSPFPPQSCRVTLLPAGIFLSCFKSEHWKLERCEGWCVMLSKWHFKHL